MSWKKEIAKELSFSQKTSVQKTTNIINGSLDMIVEILSKEGRIELRNFGVLEVVKRKARTGKNPKTGEVVFIPSKYSVKFRPGKEMISKIIEEERKNKIENNNLLESYTTEGEQDEARI
jgi:nucleoid DNA-binding protein